MQLHEADGADNAVLVLSNTLTSVPQTHKYAMAAAIGAARRSIQRVASRSAGADMGRADRVLASEVGARTVGLLQGTKIGLVEAWRTLRTGLSGEPFTKVEVATGEAIPGRPGKVLRAPTRALAAEDELFKGIARQMALNGLATRRVGLSGLKGEEAKRAIADPMDNPPDAEVRRPDGLGPDLFSPVRTGTARNDPTTAIVLDNGIHVGVAGRRIEGMKGRDLSPAEYSAFQSEAGPRIKRAPDTLVRDPAWLAAAQEDQQARVTKVAGAIRKSVRVGMFGGPVSRRHERKHRSGTTIRSRARLFAHVRHR